MKSPRTFGVLTTNGYVEVRKGSKVPDDVARLVGGFLNDTDVRVGDDDSDTED